MTVNSKRLFLNAFLLFVVVMLTWFVLTRNQEQADSPETLYDESMGDDVTQVVIHVAGHDDLYLENRGEEGNRQWKITRPIQQDADKSKVRVLFTLLTDPVSSSYDAADMDLAKYGLDKENLSVSFNGVKLVLGDLNQVSQTRYVLKGDRIYLIAETVSGLIEMGVDGFKVNDKKETGQEASEK